MSRTWTAHSTRAKRRRTGTDGSCCLHSSSPRQRPHTDLRFQTRARSLQHLPALSASFLLKAAFPKRSEQESVSATASCLGIVLLRSADSFLWELPLETNLRRPQTAGRGASDVGIETSLHNWVKPLSIGSHDS